MSRSTTFTLLRPGPGLQGLAVSLAFWVPIISGLLDLTFGGWHDFPRRWLVSASIADTVCLLCFGGAILVRELWMYGARRRNGARPAPKLALGFYFGLSALLMPLALPVGLMVGAVVGGWVGRPYRPDVANYRIGLGFGAVITALFFLHRARGQARERVRELENANLKAQLAALTAEMNPHLLFNALNTIASLVHDDPDLAEQTVLELAEVYRGVLRAARGSTHSLADELRLCEAYLRVETARYGDRLEVSFSVEDTLDATSIQVPMLLLQPLVENAVKHGIAPLAKGGRIAVRVVRRAAGLAVMVEDDGVGLGRSTVAGNGRALANCKERLRLTFGERASLDLAQRAEGGARAEIFLPTTTALP